MGGNLLESRWPTALIAIVVYIFFAASCADEGLDGPERLQFDEVHSVYLSVDRGDVMVLGRDSAAATVIDRWSSGHGGFETLAERESGDELFVDAKCQSNQSCRVRYDLALAPEADVEARVGEGELNLINIGGAVDAVVERGRLDSSGLRADYGDVTVLDGTARLIFAEAPGNLMLRVGEEASMVVYLPTERYRCNFSENAESISIGGVRCSDQASNTLRVDPPDASVRFVVRSQDG